MEGIVRLANPSASFVYFSCQPTHMPLFWPSPFARASNLVHTDSVKRSEIPPFNPVGGPVHQEPIALRFHYSVLCVGNVGLTMLKIVAWLHRQ